MIALITTIDTDTDTGGKGSGSWATSLTESTANTATTAA